jgi:hypothetical protein
VLAQRMSAEVLSFGGQPAQSAAARRARPPPSTRVD